MTFIEALLLALALCVDTLVVSTTTAFHEKMRWHRGLLLAAILAFSQFAFPLLGAFIGDMARSFIEAVDHWVAFGLLAFIGGKMIVESGKVKVEGDAGATSKFSTSHSPLSTYFFLGVATSIDGLAVGIGLGLDMPVNTVLWVVAVIGVVTFLVALLGIFLGKRNIPIPERTASIIAGIVLIGLGVKILIEHLFFQ